ncbi:transposase [Penicillium manginii]|uniref:transposase n=1 Tax=Penicillium manginii TaxID=203109 RepID=UPI0025493D0F|nr:transposase [Penicillium manginii]KAJ5743349.1 transposase [Penicillium manginii]
MRRFGTEISGNRRPGGELSSEARAAIIYAHECGVSPTKMAAEFNVARSTIYSTIKRFREHQTLKSLPRSGAPKVYRYSTIKYTCLLARREPWLSLSELSARIPSHPSRSTIKRFLRSKFLQRYRARRCIPISRENARKRVQFCRNWRTERYNSQLQSFIFSDECSVQRIPNLNGQYITRLRGEAYRQGMVQVKVHVKDICQMVWAGIWLGGRTKLVVMERDFSEGQRGHGGGYTTKSYLKALEEGFIEHYEPGTIFQQDNAKIHRSYVAQRWFERHGIHVMEWPPRSPDLNPIEPVWRMLKRKLYELYPNLLHFGTSEADWKLFRECISEAWDVLDQNKIDSIIRSMPQRVSETRKARGYYTRF